MSDHSGGSLVWRSDDAPLHARYSSHHTVSGVGVGKHFNSHPITIFPSSMNALRDLLILNLTLQVFDGLFSYQVFYWCARRQSIVAAAISSWGVIYGLLYKKTLACFLLLVIFALRHRHALLVKRAMVLTASA